MRTENKTARLAGRLTITELEQIRQRAEAATPGPWDKMNRADVFTKLGGINVQGEEAEHGSWYIAECSGLGTPEEKDNAIFIAASRADIPALLTEVETLITEKAAARRMLDELIGEMANADEAGYALAPETVRSDLEKIRKELIDHGE